MDNRGTSSQINFEIRRYAAFHNIQDPSEYWPFGAICEYTYIMDLSCRVPMPDRRGKQVVEAPESSSRGINPEAENVADENNREIEIDIPREGETDSEDDAAHEEAQRRTKGKMVVSGSENESESETDSEDDRQLNVAIQESWYTLNTQNVEAPESSARRNTEPRNAVDENNLEMETDIPREGETDSEDDVEYQRDVNVAIWEYFNTQNMEAPESSTRREAENVVDENNLGAEYDRELNATILESLKTCDNTSIVGPNLARGNIGNDSASNPVMDCPNEAGVEEGAQTEALDTARGTIEPTESSGTKLKESITRPPVSSRGRLLRPTFKLLQQSGATDAPAGEGTSGSKQKNSIRPRIPVCADAGLNDATLPSKRKRNGGASIKSQSKQKAVKPAVPRFNEGERTLNGRPRGVSKQQGSQHNRLQSGEVGVSEPSRSRSVLGQASRVNGVARQVDVANPDGSDVSGEVGGSGPRGSGSVLGQVSRANGVARQADVANPDGSDVGGEVGGSGPTGSGSVFGLASRANGVVCQADVANPDGSDVCGEVGGSGPSEPTSVVGQASVANAMGRQTDMVVPLPEPMVCVTNRNPMDLAIEEAKQYMRSDNRVSATQKVKLFGTYIS